jgi:hypothetical protein
MCENGVAQVRIWHARQDSHLYHGHDLAGFGADIVKARMRSSRAATSAFIKPCLSSIVCVQSTALAGSFATRASIP